MPECENREEIGAFSQITDLLQGDCAKNHTFESNRQHEEIFDTEIYVLLVMAKFTEDTDTEDDMETEEDGVFGFLLNRGLEEEVQKMKSEKIDESMLAMMEDNDLSKFIKKYGDRMAVREYIISKKKLPTCNKKNVLLQKLREKLGVGESSQRNNPVPKKKYKPVKRLGNQNAVRRTRKIELGWLNFKSSNKTYIQVKSKKGGGTRKLDMDKESTYSDIMEKATTLFFPSGRSPVGAIDDFECILKDYTERDIPKNTSIRELYDMSCMSVLRFYLATKKQPNSNIQTESNEDEELPEISLTNKKIVPSHTNSIISKESIEVLTFNKILPIHTDTQNCVTIDMPDISRVKKTSETVDNTEHSDLTKGSDLHSTKNVTPNINSDNLICTNERSISKDVTLNVIEDIFNQDGIVDLQQVFYQQKALLQQFDQDIVFEQQVRLEGNSMADDNELPCKLRINRGNVMMDLIKKCTNINPFQDITIEMVLQNGQSEVAEDNGGVLRDCLSQFWEEFYLQCTTGNSFKVPFLRHDFGELEWTAIAKIVFIGWRLVKYFPISIAPPIFELSVTGKLHSNLRDVFFAFISKSELEIIKQALEDIDSVDKAELIEVLDLHQCRKLPTKENIASIVEEIGHKEIIQETTYVIDTWKPILSMMDINLQETYEQLEPTTQKALKVLEFPQSLDSMESVVAKHLKRFIRDCDFSLLKKFLRFCTGADTLVCQVIHVTFNKLAGLQRRPVAHTCGCVLELSTQYDNYPEFKAEFDNILNSDIWVMDFV